MILDLFPRHVLSNARNTRDYTSVIRSSKARTDYCFKQRYKQL
jgi:hypothetical protein